MSYKVVEKPWGYETWITSNEYYICRILDVKKGEAVSLQYHEEKLETIYILEGTAEYYIQKPGEEMQKRIIKPGDILEHQPYEIHREIALEDFKFFEVSTPHMDDIIRVEDKYGRE